jgi:hypothetical protein
VNYAYCLCCKSLVNNEHKGTMLRTGFKILDNVSYPVFICENKEGEQDN